MRITVTLDEGMLDKARAVAARSGKPLRVVVNEALRLGLEQFE